MTREEFIMAAKAAKNKGNPELAKKFLIEALNSKSITPQVLAQEEDAAAPRSADPATFWQGLQKVGAGAGARGNEALMGLNPFAGEKEREFLAERRERVNAMPGSNFLGTLGEMTTDTAMLAPLSAIPGVGIGAAALRSALAALTEAATHPGDLWERGKHAALGGAGNLLGEGAFAAGRVLAKPFAHVPDVEVDKIVQDAASRGVKLSAKDVNNSKALAYLDKALDYLPFSSGSQDARKVVQKGDWQREVLKESGVTDGARKATPKVMADIKKRTQGVYDDIESRYDLFADFQLIDAAKALKTKYNKKLVKPGQGYADPYLDQIINLGPSSGSPQYKIMAGTDYQSWRGSIGKAGDDMSGRDSNASETLKELQHILDKAYFRVIPSAKKDALQKNNYQYRVMKEIEKTIDPISGDMVPGKLLANLTRSEKPRVIYGEGNQELTKLAKIGAQVIRPSTRDTGSGQTSFWMNTMGHPFAGIGSIMGGGYIGDQLGNVAVGVGVPMASGLLTNQTSRMMANPAGYLAKGLTPRPKLGGLLKVGTRGAIVGGTQAAARKKSKKNRK